MVIKVCGIKTQENVEFLSQANIDMIGLNFYQPSVRYISDAIDPNIFSSVPNKIKKIGVFVNESKSIILAKSLKFNLDYVQLHGDESPDFCAQIANHFPIIKVFRVGQEFDFKSTQDYDSAQYFLFDTHTIQFGGSGKKFDWDILRLYTYRKSFLLSGGIGPEDADHILQINHPQFMGIDINSKFEMSPGIKDKNLVLPFINNVK